MHRLLAAWRAFELEQGRFILPGDERLLDEPGLTRHCGDWQGFISDPDFGAVGDGRIHLDLLPMPFVGNLEAASVFLLMANPGLAPSDYFGEYEIADYRSALRTNLRQTDSGFLFLEPRFAWHGGFLYWNTKLRSLIDTYGRRAGITYGEARRLFQAKLAVLQLVPYHSLSFAVPDGVSNALESVALARAFVREELLPRARAGRCLIVVCRRASAWGLPDCENVVTYAATEARSAHLGPRSRGGAAILAFLEQSTGGRPDA